MDLKQQLLLLFFGALFFLLFSIAAARSYPLRKIEDEVKVSSTTSIPTPAPTAADNSTKSTPGVTRPSKIQSGRRTTRKPSKSPKIILPNFRHQDDTDKRLVSLQTVYDPVRGRPVVVFVDGSGRLLINEDEENDNEVDDKKEEVHLQPSHMKVVGDEWEQLPGSFNFDDYLFFVGEDGNGGGDDGGNLGGDNGEDDNGGSGDNEEEEEEEGDRNDEEEDWSVANYYDGEYGDGDYSGTLDGDGDEGTF